MHTNCLEKVIVYLQVEKKRIYDPQVLLNNMNVDEFLATVHGPI